MSSTLKSWKVESCKVEKYQKLKCWKLKKVETLKCWNCQKCNCWKVELWSVGLETGLLTPIPDSHMQAGLVLAPYYIHAIQDHLKKTRSQPQGTYAHALLRPRPARPPEEEKNPASRYLRSRSTTYTPYKAPKWGGLARRFWSTFMNMASRRNSSIWEPLAWTALWGSRALFS